MLTRADCEVIFKAIQELDRAERELADTNSWEPFGPLGSFPFQLDDAAAAQVRDIVRQRVLHKVSVCRSKLKELGVDPGKPPYPGGK